MSNFYTDNPDLKFHLQHPLMEKITRLKEQNFTDKEKYDYAPLDHEDALNSYDKVLEIIGEISGEIIDANADEVDKTGPQLINNEVVYANGTQQNMDALKEAGLFGMSLPREYGGLNFSIVPYVMSAEIVSRADAGFANIWGLQDCAETIHEFASEDIKNAFLPRICNGETAAMDLTEPDAGSDLQAVQLKATLDEKTGNWILNGVKRFITNGDAHVSLVLARSEEGTTDGRGLSLFVYDRNSNAVTVRRIENKLGIKGSPTCELVFRNAPALLVGDRKLGLIKYVMSLMNSARLGVGAQSVGIAEAAYRIALKYATEREQFGKPIIHFPAVYEMLTNMRVKTEAIRSLLYETSRFVDIYKSLVFIQQTRSLDAEEKNDLKYYQKNADILTPLLKLFSSEYCNQIAYDAIQIHGGTGYMKDFAAERIYRDARITTIYEGTSQLQVVAAIRGVGNGAYLKLMKEYGEKTVKPDIEYMKNQLAKMTDQFAKTIEKVNSHEDAELYDFHARRLVEMAGNIVIGYLLLADANRNEKFNKSAEIFIRKAKSENVEKVSFINNFDSKDTGAFKI
ncbi:MAG: acyl-CoA dehydrogenase family protein [Lentimicrobiaceae bacterium]|nr:acyl-CoA dehydrogenase family protein [Lentimicrobiaceae bacterium]